MSEAGTASVYDAATRKHATKRRSLPLPESVTPVRIDWVFALGLIWCHLVASLAVLPYFFSWTGVILVPLGYYVFGTIGINICFHRLLTHRSFATPKWLEHTIATIGVCAMQDTPAMWVGTHRRHHQHSDEQPDPHSPLVTFLWGHLFWGMIKNTDLQRRALFNRYARDITRDPLYAWFEQPNIAYLVVFASWCVFFIAGFAVELACAGTITEAVQFGASLLVWGVFVRAVVTWHITWSINSVSHLWGYRNYETRDSSRNNFFVGFLANGEGWHNNHHAHPRSARHGHKWWELDIGWLTIRALALFGLAWNIELPPRADAAGKEAAR